MIYLGLLILGLGVAERPQITGTPVGSMFFRFRSFATNYASWMRRLFDTDKAAFTDAAISLVGLAGTAGIPFYSAIQKIAASQFGGFLPEIDPVKETFGLDIGQALDPFLRPPQSLEQFIGPVFGPAARIVTGAIRGEERPVAIGARQLLGSLGRVGTAAVELSEGGITRTPSGRPIARRTTGQILASATGTEPFPRQARARLGRQLELAIQAGDRAGERRILREMRRKGLLGTSAIASLARSRVTRDEQETLLGSLFSP